MDWRSLEESQLSRRRWVQETGIACTLLGPFKSASLAVDVPFGHLVQVLSEEWQPQHQQRTQEWIEGMVVGRFGRWKCWDILVQRCFSIKISTRSTRVFTWVRENIAVKKLLKQCGGIFLYSIDRTDHPVEVLSIDPGSLLSMKRWDDHLYQPHSTRLWALFGSSSRSSQWKFFFCAYEAVAV